MNPNDYRIVQKVANDSSRFDWHPLLTDHDYFEVIEFPVEAEKRGETFYSDITNGLTIVVGAYSSRFYYEEDRFSWDRKTYVVIVSTKNNNNSPIAFITNEDFEKWNRENRPNFKIKFSKLAPHEDEKNAVEELYDYVNREVNGIDELYNEFLNED